MNTPPIRRMLERDRPFRRSRPPRRRRCFALMVAALLLLTAGVLTAARLPGDGAAPLARAQEGEFEARLQVSGASELAAFDATLLFDAEVLSPTALLAGDFLPEGAELLALRAAAPGRVVVGAYSPHGETVTGDGLVATVTFARLASRSPRLRLDAAESGLYDATGSRLGPPARLLIGGMPPARLLLPWLAR